MVICMAGSFLWDDPSDRCPDNHSIPQITENVNEAHGDLRKYIPTARGGAYTDGDRATHIYYGKEHDPMKIIILRTPALVAPILRKMFGIRKEKKR